MRRPVECAFVLAAACLTGCAAPAGLLTGAPGGPAFAASPGLSVQAAAQRVALGRSTRADVATALGAAEAVRFDSGWEVWVYRARGTRAPQSAPELVILFGADGVVRKLRLRPADSLPPAAALAAD